VRAGIRNVDNGLQVQLEAAAEDRARWRGVTEWSLASVPLGVTKHK